MLESNGYLVYFMEDTAEEIKKAVSSSKYNWKSMDRWSIIENSTSCVIDHEQKLVII